MAGAQALPDGDAEAIALEYAILNGKTGDVIVPMISDDNLNITVTIKRDAARYLSKVITSNETTELNVRAVATITRNETPVEIITEEETDSGKPVHSVSGVLPLAIEKPSSINGFEYGELYALKEGGGSGRIGNYGGMSLGGTGADVFKKNLRDGYDGVLTVGDKIYTEPGNMNSAKDPILDRIAADPDATYDTVEDGSPRLVTVMIIEKFPNGRSKPAEIVGFARFFIESVTGNWQTNGRFLERVVPNSTPGDGTDYGAHAPETTTTTTTTYTTTYTLPQLTD